MVGLLGAAMGCSERQHPPIELNTGRGHEQIFTPQSAYAEYVELPQLRNELRLTLASYQTSCERFTPPPPGGVLVTIQLALPTQQRLEAGTFPWPGPDARIAPGNPVTSAYAEPGVRLGGVAGALQFPAGGGMQVTSARLERFGEVGGTLAFEAPAAVGHGASEIRGHFRAVLCRVHVATGPNP